jgi:radical SAM superfamily enzyme YgiQ (UPF0313 family)
MIDLLLVYPPYLAKYKNPPLGLAYIGAMAEAKGMTVQLIDMDPHGVDYNDLESMIRELKPSALGISFMTNMFSAARKVSSIAKQVYPDMPVIMGGNHASGLPDELLQINAADYVVFGEGERTIVEFMEQISKDSPDYSSVKGLVYKDGDKIIKNAPRELIDDLDSIPFPIWNQLPCEKYSDMVLGSGEERPAFSIMSTRGCPAKCTFCSSHTVFTRKYRARTAENIFEEMVYLYEQFGARHFNFVDDTFTIQKPRVFELCDLIIESGIQFDWVCNARANTVNLDYLRKMRAAGCMNICFGVESGDAKVRDNIDKFVTTEQIINSHAWAKEAGMVVSSFFMVGNEGEGWEEVEKTIKFAAKLHTDDAGCSIATPYPDTPLWHLANAKGWIKIKDWDKYHTSPHVIQDYVPVSINDKMNQQEILDAYYYVNAAFAKRKLQTKYGKYYYFNPNFFRQEVYKRIQDRGIREFWQLSLKVLRGILFEPSPQQAMHHR